MARRDGTGENRAADAAGMLRRLGFAVLALAAPVLAIGSRRGLDVVVPVGIVLLVIARVIETEGEQPLARLRRALMAPAGLGALFLVFWAALSLVWTPFPSAALDRVLNLVGFGLLGLVAAAALPDRMRGTNLNLLPIGVALASLIALSLEIRPMVTGVAMDGERAGFLDRGLLLLAVMTPPAVTWLASKDRLVSAFFLAAVATASLILGQAIPALIALVLGAAMFAVSTVSLKAGRMLALIGLPGLVLAAPLLPFVLRATSKLTLGTEHAKVNAIRTWARIVTDDPVRLFTGHGLDTATRAKAAGLVPPTTPSGLLFEVWYDLGFLGAAALAFLLVRAILGATRLHGGAAPGALMTLTVGFVLAVLGEGSVQSWWLMGLSVGAVMVVAVDHGQYRTRRPASRFAPPKARRVTLP